MSAIDFAANAMAGARPICPSLLHHYRLPAAAKQAHLETPEARDLFDNLPPAVAAMLGKGFLDGAFAEDIPGWQETVAAHFMQNSRIIPALVKNPGTFTMLEQMYHFEAVAGAIDTFFLRCKSGGQALRNRYQAVNATAGRCVSDIIDRKGGCLMIDLGSGPGRNALDICRSHAHLNGRLKAECIDIDPEALASGKALARRHGVHQIEFVPTSMTRLHRRYPGNVDLGLMIGVLCGLPRAERVALLRAVKPYFAPGGRLMAASLLETMAVEDLLCAYILRETTGWTLQYPRPGELAEVFEQAGWRYEGGFLEEPTRFYEIGIGIA